jgi:hypothetical protein
MATEAFQPLRSPALHRGRPVNRPINRTAERFFFGSMAILLCAIVVLGFSRTYFAAGMVLAPLPNALVHIHGAAFTLWMALFFTQAALVSARRVAWHRALGTVAFCLPPIMIVLGIVTALDSLRRGHSIGSLSPYVSLAIPFFNIATFAILILAAWRTRRQPDAHKRLILYATICLTEAAFGRFPTWARFGMPQSYGMQVLLAAVLLLPILYDLFSLHRVHRSSLWGAAVGLVLSVAAVPIGMTPPWQAFAGFLARHVAPHV